MVRKGKNDDGQDTFLVQAGAGRAAALTGGFPSTRAALFGYDAVVIANVEGDYFTRAQLAHAADFVSERGGGLLVLGGRSFAQRGLIGTPLEERAAGRAERSPRRPRARPPLPAERRRAHNKVTLTAEGETHPVMRIGASDRRTRASSGPGAAGAGVGAPLGGPRPGATVLAVTSAPGGAVFPVVAVQRYGRGRSMVFAGEASWRWKMMLASTDRTHEFFWRQAARWLATAAPDPVAITRAGGRGAGDDDVEIDVDVRDAAFVPVGRRDRRRPR